MSREVNTPRSREIDGVVHKCPICEGQNIVEADDGLWECPDCNDFAFEPENAITEDLPDAA